MTAKKLVGITDLGLDLTSLGEQMARILDKPAPFVPIGDIVPETALDTPAQASFGPGSPPVTRVIHVDTGIKPDDFDAVLNTPAEK